MVAALVGRSPGARTLRRRLLTEDCHAPHLIDAEVGNVLRRFVVRGALPPSDAETLLESSHRLVDHRYEMTGALAGATWGLHQRVTFYDALYVGLARALSARLLTADRRLAGIPDVGCAVELVVPD
jgi:predicted nucleic acid-binding protein